MESRIDEFREFVKKYPLIKEDVKNNNISTEDAEKLIKRQPFEELGYAKLDSHR